MKESLKLVISNYYEWLKIERNDKKSINYFVDKIAIPKPSFRNIYNCYLIKPNGKEKPILCKPIVEFLTDINLRVKLLKNGIIILYTKTKLLFTVDMKSVVVLDIQNSFPSDKVTNISNLTENLIFVELLSGKTMKLAYAAELNLLNSNMPFEIIRLSFTIS